jgi:ABC-type dipeptide/oligopeptide/nickel transport system permease component
VRSLPVFILTRLLLQGMTIVAAVLVVSANLIVDVIQAAIDPRVRAASA